MYEFLPLTWHIYEETTALGIGIIRKTICNFGAMRQNCINKNIPPSLFGKGAGGWEKSRTLNKLTSKT